MPKDRGYTHKTLELPGGQEEEDDDTGSGRRTPFEWKSPEADIPRFAGIGNPGQFGDLERE